MTAILITGHQLDFRLVILDFRFSNPKSASRNRKEPPPRGFSIGDLRLSILQSEIGNRKSEIKIVLYHRDGEPFK